MKIEELQKQARTLNALLASVNDAIRAIIGMVDSKGVNEAHITVKMTGKSAEASSSEIKGLLIHLVSDMNALMRIENDDHISVHIDVVEE